jgi:23S rRNA (uracil1939-C5)-methyltransferase
MEHTLTIHKLIHGGKGLGTLADGMVAMVAGVLPGERVTVRETKVFRGHKEAELVRIDEASPDRITPPCPHYGSCGGCNLQHATYEAQLRIKQQILEESLQRARLELPDNQPLPTLPSPQVFGYRHRIRLHLDDEGRLGYHQATSNTVVPIRRCLLATDAINRVLESLGDAGVPVLLRDRFFEIELMQSPADDRVILVLHPRPRVIETGIGALAATLSTLVDAVVLAPSKAGRSPQPDHKIFLEQHFSIHDHEYHLRWAPGCFFQVNAEQNPRLVALALDSLHSLPPAFAALDLFCGMGNFSIPLALHGAQVIGIEHNRESIHWATTNSSDNNLTASRFIAGNVVEKLRRMVRRHQEMDCILIDPPRQGLGQAAALVPQLQPRLIVAISCDPATQARDLQAIIAGGYHLSRITPVDMFPQTHHIESVALLERNC